MRVNLGNAMERQTLDIDMPEDLPSQPGPQDGQAPEDARAHAAVAEHLQRLVEHFEALDTRIGCLAQALHIPLQTPADLTQLLAHGDDPTVSREAEMHEELRGLLVLRYDAVVRLADESGAQAARDILRVVHERLLAKGYPPLNLDG